MRGLLEDQPTMQDESGITPAHAGLTMRDKRNVPPDGDHPRACGAYITTVLTSPNSLGSPPRMRGLPALNFLTD